MTQHSLRSQAGCLVELCVVERVLGVLCHQLAVQRCCLLLLHAAQCSTHSCLCLCVTVSVCVCLCVSVCVCVCLSVCLSALFS